MSYGVCWTHLGKVKDCDLSLSQAKTSQHKKDRCTKHRYQISRVPCNKASSQIDLNTSTIQRDKLQSSLETRRIPFILFYYLCLHINIPRMTLKHKVSQKNYPAKIICLPTITIQSMAPNTSSPFNFYQVFVWGCDNEVYYHDLSLTLLLPVLQVVCYFKRQESAFPL